MALHFLPIFLNRQLQIKQSFNACSCNRLAAVSLLPACMQHKFQPYGSICILYVCCITQPYIPTCSMNIHYSIIRSHILGTIPGPLLFGSILDNVCLVWQEKCDEDGSCWIYDSKRMGQYFYILTVAVKATTISLLIIAYKLYKPPPEPSESGITPVACSEDLPTSPAANVETTSSKL